jgi:hypothetical protein
MFPPCLFGRKVIRQLQLKRQVCKWIIEKAEFEVTVNYPHITDGGVQHVTEEAVPPLVAPCYARIIAPKLVCCIYTPHVASIQKAGSDFLPFTTYFPINKVFYARL